MFERNDDDERLVLRTLCTSISGREFSKARRAGISVLGLRTRVLVKAYSGRPLCFSNCSFQAVALAQASCLTGVASPRDIAASLLVASEAIHEVVAGVDVVVVMSRWRRRCGVGRSFL